MQLFRLVAHVAARSGQVIHEYVAWHNIPWPESVFQSYRILHIKGGMLLLSGILKDPALVSTACCCKYGWAGPSICFQGSAGPQAQLDQRGLGDHDCLHRW